MSTVVVSNWIIIANFWMTITQLHSAHSPRPCLNWIWVWFRCLTVLYVVNAKIKEPTWHGLLSGWGRRSSSGIGCWAPTARSGRRTKPSLSQYTGPSPLIPGINPGYRKRKTIIRQNSRHVTWNNQSDYRIYSPWQWQNIHNQEMTSVNLWADSSHGAAY